MIRQLNKKESGGHFKKGGIFLARKGHHMRAQGSIGEHRATHKVLHYNNLTPKGGIFNGRSLM